MQSQTLPSDRPKKRGYPKMGFDSVYRCLLDVFPQVDSRLLWAVAIEHSKDPDMAVEIVLSEILPYVSKHSIVSEDLGIDSSVYGDGGAEHEDETSVLTYQQTSFGKSISAGETSTARKDTDKTDPENEILHSNSNCRSEEQNPPTGLYRYPNIDINPVQGNEESEELPSKHQCQEENVKSSSSQISKTMFKASVLENNAGQIFANVESDEPASLGEAQDMNIRDQCEEISQVMAASLIREMGDCNGSLNGDAIRVSFGGPGKDEYGRKCPHAEYLDASTLDASTLDSENFFSQQKPTAGVTGHCVEVCSSSLSECENVKPNKHITIEQLEEIVEAAKNNKKTLFSAMESVMNMMSRVELQEKAVEQAKEEAARGGLDILVKVQDLKRMLAHAKEANDMHAGEVYGEKAILATEIRELQGRLQILSDERDKALGILDEMDQTLEARQTAAEELRKAAEQEKLEKEESAQIALAEQEAIMEKVVQESKILQQEAEENSKLRDFLMDRGQVVDALQGEISVICHDVRLLKEKFDERVPLSKSISSSQTSCIVASSGLFLRSMTSNGVLVPQTGETSDSPKEISPQSSVDSQSGLSPQSMTSNGVLVPLTGETSNSPKEIGPQSSVYGGGLLMESNLADHKDAMDEGWEWFENETET